MSTSPNLLITDISASQNQKEVTHNAAIHELDLALTNLLSTAMADADVTLTTGEGNQALANMVFIFTGANTAARNVIVPTNKKLYIVSNATTGGFKITVKTSGGTGVDILASDGYVIVYCDGTNIVAVGGTSSGGTAFGGVSKKTADYTIVTGDNDTSVVLTTGSHTFTPPAPDAQTFVYLLNTGSGTLTLSHNSKNINGTAADMTFAQGEGGLLVSDATNYFVIKSSVSTPPSRTSAFKFTIDGLGSVPATGTYGQISVPFACTIVGWNLTADVSGSGVIDVLRSTGGSFPTTSSIAGTDKPTLSSAQRAHDVALSGWGSTALAQYDELQIDLSSVTTCTRFDLTIYVTIP